MSADPADPAPSLSGEDREWLARAVNLAARGWGRVRPNPMVGCVLVHDGTVVGEGWHEEFGGPHAEVNALRAAGAAGAGARGATAYVTLEPCNHHGKTPPCVDALLEAGVARVVFGAADPGGESGRGGEPGSGRGGERLEEAGVRVTGPAHDPALGRDVDPAFFHIAERGRPYVAVKLAISTDGCIGAKPGARTTITGEEAHQEVHRLRAGFDAILVGGTTAHVDDPLLTVRGAVEPRVPPTRVVLDPGCNISPDARLFQTLDQAPVLVLVTEEAPADRVQAVERAGARVEVVGFHEGIDATGSRADLASALDLCWRLGLRSVLCEGGGRLASALIRDGLVQRCYLLRAPVTLGAEGVPAFPGLEEEPGGDGWRQVAEPQELGDDTLLVYDRED